MSDPGAPVQLSRRYPDLFIPHYRPFKGRNWELRVMPFGFAAGYWSEPVLIAGMPALLRGRESWMSITPMEIESQEIGIRLAKGHVLIFGLGMGWAAAATAAMPAVDRVTVVERDPEIHELVETLDPWAQLPSSAQAKLSLVEGDAFEFVPEGPVDLLMPDIWLPAVHDGRLDEVQRMQARVGAASIYFWGQELELARHAIAAGRQLDRGGLAETVAGIDLPLIGLDYPDYAEKLVAASRRWMRGRWLPGSEPPW